MGRKVGFVVALLVAAIASAGLAGGQVGAGFLWWGDHEPIYIYGNGDFTFENGVMSGSGSADDPYVIEGWRIHAPNADYGIYIDHTTSHFVIRNCVIEGARIAGIYFNSVRNGWMESTQISRSDTAVYFMNARGNTLRGNVFAECDYGVVMVAESQDNLIVGNAFLENGLAAHDPRQINRWSDASGGNYWSDYRGVDVNGDGFGDEPYYPVWDLRPRMNPPEAWTHVEAAGPTLAGNAVAPDGSLVVTSETPISLTSRDPGSGLAEIRYSIDGGPWETYTGPIFLLGDDGPKRLTYYGVDRLGNAEPRKTLPFFLDNHAPETMLAVGDPSYTDERGTWITSSTRLTLYRTQESTYGRTQTFYRIDTGPWRSYSAPFVITGPDGPHRITFYSRNASGVTEPLRIEMFMKDDAPPLTRGAHASSPEAASVSVRVGPSEEETVPTGSAPSSEEEASAEPGEEHVQSPSAEGVAGPVDSSEGATLSVQTDSSAMAEPVPAPSVQTAPATTAETAPTTPTQTESATVAPDTGSPDGGEDQTPSTTVEM